MINKKFTNNVKGFNGLIAWLKQLQVRIQSAYLFRKYWYVWKKFNSFSSK